MTFKFGVTGGIASGKNTIVELFENFAKEDNVTLNTYDLDIIAKEIYCKSNAPAYGQVLNEFGGQILNTDTTVNFEALGRIVFSDLKKLKRLEEIIHPYLRDSLLNKFNQKGMHCVNAALLVEKNWMNFLDNRLVIVSVSKDVQYTRLKKRNSNLIELDISERLALQLSDEERVKQAEVQLKGKHPYIILNNDSKELLAKRARFVWGELLREYNGINSTIS